MLYQEAKTWSVRPSSLLAISEEYPAYCFDQAVGLLGRRIENELEAVEGRNEAETKMKRERILAKYIDLGEGKKSGFADPMLMLQK